MASIYAYVRISFTRTDFYLIQEKADQAYGFPAGASEQLVKKVIILII